MENFDAVGDWRTTDSSMAINADGKPDPKTKKTWTIDPAGALHGGPAFKDFFELAADGVEAVRSIDIGDKHTHGGGHVGSVVGLEWVGGEAFLLKKKANQFFLVHPPFP
jgi:hypothetical protein